MLVGNPLGVCEGASEVINDGTAVGKLEGRLVGTLVGPTIRNNIHNSRNKVLLKFLARVTMLQRKS